MQDTKLFETILGITTPWHVARRVEHPFRGEALLGAASLWGLVHQRVRVLNSASILQRTISLQINHLFNHLTTFTEGV